MTTRQLAFIYLIGIFFCISCSDNNSQRQKSNNKILTKLDTVTEYIPENYQEKITDTILDADINLRVIIKKTTLMDKFVIQTFDQDSNHIKKVVFRDSKINIKIKVGGQSIFDSTLTKEIFPQIGDEDFLRQATMNGVWIEKYDKKEQRVLMSCKVTVPDTDWSYNFSIHVDTKGKKKILLEDIQ